MRISDLRHIKDFKIWKMPKTMRGRYLKCKLEHRLPYLTLRQTLKWATGESGSQSLIREAKQSQTISNLATVSKLPDVSGFLSWPELIFLYCMIRITRPRKIVETGVANGASSSIILEAMHRNDYGSLFSIDLVFKENSNLESQLSGHGLDIWHSTPIPGSREPGWMVPQAFRERWKFYEGNSLVVLPRLLPTLGEIDLFLHDSRHTFEHMTQEFSLVWPYLKSSGYIIADGCYYYCHDAVFKFSASQKTHFNSYLKLAIIPKSKLTGQHRKSVGADTHRVEV